MKVLRNKDSGNAIERYAKSFLHAVDGIVYALRVEHNMIIIFTALIFVISMGHIFNINEFEWLFCIASIGLVAATEMINTAIEATIDLVTTEYHPLAKIAKDTASSATLIFCITSLIGGLIIFVPKIVAIL